jgi:enoyl-CoA hydratase/carnithine racemase
MSDLNRGIMKFEGADKPIVVAVSALLVLGAIAILMLWALRVAYAVN